MTLRFFALVLFTSFFYATSAQTSFQYHLLEKVNHVRDSLGIPLVKLDAILNEAALDQSYYMADKSTLTHFQETFSKETPGERVLFYEGKRTYVGENIAQVAAVYKKKDSMDVDLVATSLFNSWIKSPKHYQNITDPQYTSMGVAYWTSSEKIVYGTQVFSSNEIRLPGEFKNPEFSWGVRPAEKTCKDDDQVFETMFFANSIMSDGPNIYFEFHDLNFFKKVIVNDNDGLAIDVVLREQLPCSKENQFHPSTVHDGEMQRPIYKHDLFRTNISDNPGKILVKIGEVPKYLRNRQWDANVIIINDNTLCEYSIPVEIPEDIYPLLPIRPYADLSVDNSSTSAPPVVAIRDEMHVEIKYNRAKKNHFEFSEPAYLQLLYWAPYIKTGKIECYASVEGPSWLNAQLLAEREENALDFIAHGDFHPETFAIETKENWPLMYQQIEELRIHPLEGKTESELKYYLKTHPSPLFDSLLLDQRSTHIYATVDTVLAIASYPDYLFALHFNADLDIAELPWNTILREEYILKNEALSTELIDTFLNEKVYRTNLLGAASIGITPHIVDSVSAQALLSDLDFKDDLQRFNYAHFLTRYWFAHYSRSYRLKHVAVTISPNQLRDIINELDTQKVDPEHIVRLKINLLLSGIHYYVAHNNWGPVNNYFDEIVELVKQGEFSPQEALELALFCNYFHKFDQAVAILHELYTEKTLNENGFFALAATATLIRHTLDNDLYHQYMNAAKLVNKARYCTWLDEQFQIQRDEYLKQDFCASCATKFH